MDVVFYLATKDLLTGELGSLLVSLKQTVDLMKKAEPKLPQWTCTEGEVESIFKEILKSEKLQLGDFNFHEILKKDQDAAIEEINGCFENNHKKIKSSVIERWDKTLPQIQYFIGLYEFSFEIKLYHLNRNRKNKAYAGGTKCLPMLIDLLKILQPMDFNSNITSWFSVFFPSVHSKMLRDIQRIQLKLISKDHLLKIIRSVKENAHWNYKLNKDQSMDLANYYSQLLKTFRETRDQEIFIREQQQYNLEMKKIFGGMNLENLTFYNSGSIVYLESQKLKSLEYLYQMKSIYNFVNIFFIPQILRDLHSYQIDFSGYTQLSESRLHDILDNFHTLEAKMEQWKNRMSSSSLTPLGTISQAIKAPFIIMEMKGQLNRVIEDINQGALELVQLSHQLFLETLEVLNDLGKSIKSMGKQKSVGNQTLLIQLFENFKVYHGKLKVVIAIIERMTPVDLLKKGLYDQK